MKSKKILVIGCTGIQGGSVVNSLLKNKKFKIYGLTRYPDSKKAKKLKQKGVKIIKGNLSDRNSLKKAVKNIEYIFSVTDFVEHGYKKEIEHGTNIAEIAADSGVKHFIFSSAGSAAENTGLPHLDSKYEIEKRIDELNLPYTIIRPVFYMQNFNRKKKKILEGKLVLALEPHVSLQLIDVNNIGEFVVEILQKPQKYISRKIELASDELTPKAIAIRFSDILDINVETKYLSFDELKERRSKEYAEMFRWINENRFKSNIDTIRSEHQINFNRLEDYIERDWKNI